MEKKEIYLIDGSAYLYRAFHAIPNLSTSKGTPTNAVFGVTTMLLKLMKERNPEYAAIFFDVKGPTFRHRLYDQYKANRPAMPDDLAEQIPFVKDVVRALNVPVVEKDGFEADDLIGTYARLAEERGWSAVMVTGDKDFMQLVTDRCTILDPMKDRVVNRALIKEEFNIEPEQVIDMLGLAGDTSDNVPGVPGVGPKTALSLINDFGSMHDIYERLDELKSKKALYKKLSDNREQAFLSRELVTIDRFVELPEDLELFFLKPYDRVKLTHLFKTFEFKKLHQEFFEESEKIAAAVKKDYRCLTDLKEIEAITLEIRNLALASDNDSGRSDGISGKLRLAIDTETTSLSPMLADLVGISFSYRPHEAFYIPVGHVESPAIDSSDREPDIFGGSGPEKKGCDGHSDSGSDSDPDSDFCGEADGSNADGIDIDQIRYIQPDKQAVLEIMKPLLEDPAIEKVGQNIKYDYIILARNGINMQGIVSDTMIESYLLNPSGRGHNLDQIALDLLGHKNITYEEVTSVEQEHGRGRGKKQLLFSEVAVEKAIDYACEDADITLLVHGILEKRISENELDELMSTIEVPLIPVLAGMEMTGIKVDKERLRQLSSGFEKELESMEKEIFSIAGESFNINSSQQLGVILFEKLKLPVQKKTKKKTGYSTDISVLTELASQHQLPALILRYRSIGKLKSTYSDALQELIHPETGRIHTSFNQAVTATGRLSSSDPNLQNIPIRTDEGRSIRGAFIPEKGCKLVSADYSQIELRILAHVADDRILIDAFRNDEDIHTRTAAEVFQAMPGLITDDLRRQAKAINFGIVYGMGAFKLSNELSISRKMAQTYIDNYFARYSGVKSYIDSKIEEAKVAGEVTTLFGRKRRLDDIHSSNANIRGLAERMAINTPIQGSAADIIKLAMIRMDRALNERRLSDGRKMASRMLLSVHDEILFEVPEEELDLLTTLAKEVMEGVCELKVPLKVNIEWGDHWAEAH